MRAIAAILAMLAAPACAAEWQPLTGQALQAALAARTLMDRDTGATYGFAADGGLLQDGARGRWHVTGDTLCLPAPPACASVARHSRGLDLRLTWPDGASLDLRYVDLR
jgi:hypothetical protein